MCDGNRPAGQARVGTDAELAAGAAAGDVDAFSQLYRRHLPSARWAAYAVVGNPDDAADAVSEAAARVFEALAGGRLREGAQFRSYLLVASRNAAIDLLRRSGRCSPTDSVEDLDEASFAGPPERVVEGIDATLVARAFNTLPERWRSVLWLTEVEGLSGDEAARAIGLSPNAVAQLALRARAGLRKGFVQAHVDDRNVTLGCRFTVERLGAYASKLSSARDVAKIDRHLAECPTCRHRMEELGEVAWPVASRRPAAMAAPATKAQAA